MNCIGLIIYMHCFAPGPVVVSDFCKQVEPLVTRQEFRPSRSDSENSRRRYRALKIQYETHCVEKETK